MVIKQSGKVGFWQAIKDFWKGYVSFQGTTTRAGYWWACLGNYLLIIAAVIISFIALFASNDWVKEALFYPCPFIMWLSINFTIISVINPAFSGRWFKPHWFISSNDYAIRI